MKILVIALFIAVAAADVSHLGFNYHKPGSSYDVGQKSVTESIFSSTTPSPSLHLPLREHQDFRALITNFGSSGYSTPLQYNSGLGYSAGGSIEGGIVSSTAAPSINLNQDFVSTTAAPAINFNQGFASSTVEPSLGFNQAFVSSRPSPNVELIGSSTPSTVNFGLNSEAGFPATSNLQINSGLNYAQGASGLNYAQGASGLNYAQGAPGLFAQQYQALPGYKFNSVNHFSTPGPINFDNSAFLVQGQTTAGSLNDAFGQSTPAPILGGNYYNDDTVEINSGPVELSKQIYFFASPESDQEVESRINVIQPPVKQNLKVIFVKAPTQQISPKIQIAAPQQIEDKTRVYVLVKKPEELQQTIELQTQAPREPAKPEVYFIKYKNQQEAEEAISKVQAGQRSSEHHLSANNLGGSDFVNSIHLERTVQPVINYVKSHSSSVASLPLTGNSGIQFTADQSNVGLGFTTTAPFLGSGLSYTTSESFPNSGLSYSTTSPLANPGLSFTTTSPLKSSGLSYSVSSPFANSGLNFNAGLNSGFRLNSGYDNANSYPAFGGNFVSSTPATIAVNSVGQNSAFSLKSGIENVNSYNSQPVISSTPSTLEADSFGVSTPSTSVNVVNSQGSFLNGDSSVVNADISSNLINSGAPSLLSGQFESSTFNPVSFDSSGHIPFAKYESPFLKREVKEE